MANQDLALYGNDLLIQGGDFAIAESDPQHIADTINAFPGWWKEHPQDGVGIFQYVNSGGQDQTIKKNLLIQLKSDGYTVSNPQVGTDANGNLLITPNAQP